MKVCSKCKVEKDEGDFRVRKAKKPTHKPYLNSHCISCEKSSKTEYREKNKDKVDAATQKWREKNPDKVAAWQRRTYLKHSEKIKKQTREYEKKHWNEALQRKRNWEKNNPDKYRQSRRKQDLKSREELKRKYVRDLAIRCKGFPKSAVDQFPIIIDLIRLQIINKREIKKQLNDNKN